MSDLPAPIEAESEAEPEDDKPDALAIRAKDLLGREGSPIRKRLADMRAEIHRGFEDQRERAETQQECWDAYNCCTRDEYQNYRGDAQIYVPIIYDAENAIATRIGNQLFPPGGKWVEAVSADGDIPNDIVALLDHYIRHRKLQTQVVKSLIRNALNEGQFNLYMDWSEVSRQLVSRETRKPMIDIAPGVQIEGPGDEFEDIDEEDVIQGAPVYEVLHDSDILVLPTDADSIEEVLARHGSVTIVRRWSKHKLDQMADDDEVLAGPARELKKQMQSLRDGEPPKNIEKSLNEAVGIRSHGSSVTVWETWTMLPLKNGKYNENDGRSRLCRIWFGPDGFDLGAKRNPYWNDRCPLLSAPVEKVAGQFKGAIPVARCLSLQYEANDAANEGADAATLAAAPVIMKDPNDQTPLVLAMGAIWPKGTEILQFPDLTPRAQARIQLCIQQIFQTLSVNPSMLPQQTRSGKPNQAQVAQEQQVDILTTMVAATVLEEGILTPAMEWSVDLDYQFRDRAVTVRAFGAMGLRAELEDVAPLQNRTQYQFRWWGMEVSRNISQMQIQNQALNLLMQPQMAQALAAAGKKLDPTVVIEQMVSAVFGARVTPLLLIDERAQLSVNGELENELLRDGHDMPIHPSDNHADHLKMHQQAMRETGDPHGTIRIHMQRHLRFMEAQAKQQQMQQMQQQMQVMMQQRGQGGQRQGRRGPQPGAMSAGPRLIKSQPGTIAPDQMNRAGGVQMPRRA